MMKKKENTYKYVDVHREQSNETKMSSFKGDQAMGDENKRMVVRRQASPGPLIEEVSDERVAEELPPAMAASFIENFGEQQIVLVRDDEEMWRLRFKAYKMYHDAALALQTRDHELKSVKQEAIAKINELNARIDTLNSDGNTLIVQGRETINALNGKVQGLEQKLEGANKQLVLAGKELALVKQSSVESLALQRELMQEAIVTRNKAVVEAENELKIAKKDLVNVSDALKKVRQGAGSASDATNEAEAKAKRMEAAKDEAKRDLAKTQAELEDANNRNREHRARIAELEAGKQMANMELERKETAASRLRIDNDRLEHALTTEKNASKFLVRERDETTQELAVEKKRTLTLTDEKTKIAKDLAQAEKDIAGHVMELADARTKIRGLTDERDRIAEELKQAGVKIGEKSTELKQAEASINGLTQQLANAKNRADQISAARDDEDTLHDKEKKALKQKNKDLNAEIKELKTEIDNLTAQIEDNSQSESELVVQSSNHRSELKRATEKIRELTEEKTTADDNLFNAMAKLTEANKNFGKLKADYEELVRTTVKQVKGLEEEKKTVEEALEKMKKAKEKAVADLEADNKKATEALDKANKNFGKLKADYEELVRTTVKQVKGLEEEKKTVEEALEKMKKAKEKAVADLEADNKKATEALDKAKKARDKAEKALDKMKGKPLPRSGGDPGDDDPGDDDDPSGSDFPMGDGPGERKVPPNNARGRGETDARLLAQRMKEIEKLQKELQELRDFKDRKDREIKTDAEENKGNDYMKAKLKEIVDALLQLEKTWSFVPNASSGMSAALATALVSTPTLTVADQALFMANFACNAIKTDLDAIKTERTEVKKCLTALAEVVIPELKTYKTEGGSWIEDTRLVIKACEEGTARLNHLKQPLLSLVAEFKEFDRVGWPLFGQTIDDSLLNHPEPTVFLPALAAFFQRQKKALDGHIQSALEIQKAISKQQIEDNKAITDSISTDAVKIREVGAWVEIRLRSTAATVEIATKFYGDMLTLKSKIPELLLSSEPSGDIKANPTREDKVIELYKFFAAQEKYFEDVCAKVKELYELAKDVGGAANANARAIKPVGMAAYTLQVMQNTKAQLAEHTKRQKDLDTAFSGEWREQMRAYEEIQARYTTSASGQTLIDEKKAPKDRVLPVAPVLGQGRLTSEFKIDAMTSFIDKIVGDYGKEMDRKTDLANGLLPLSASIGGVLDKARLKTQVPSSIRVDTLVADMKPFLDAMIELVGTRDEVYASVVAELIDIHKQVTGQSYLAARTVIDSDTFDTLTGTATAVKTAVAEQTTEHEKETEAIYKAVGTFSENFSGVALGLPELSKPEQATEEKKEVTGGQKKKGGALRVQQKKATEETKDEDETPRVPKRKAAEEDEALDVRKIGRSMHSAKDVSATLAAMKQYMDRYAGRVRDRYKEDEANFNLIQAAVGKLSNQTGQDYVQSAFIPAKYTDIASSISTAADVHKTLKQTVADACTALDRALKPLPGALGVKWVIPSLILLTNYKNVVETIGDVLKDYGTGRADDDKSMGNITAVLLKLPARFTKDIPPQGAGSSLAYLNLAIGRIEQVIKEDDKSKEYYETKLGRLYDELKQVPPEFRRLAMNRDKFSVEDAADAVGYFRDRLKQDLKTLQDVYEAATKSLDSNSAAISNLESLMLFVVSVGKAKKKGGDAKKSTAAPGVFSTMIMPRAEGGGHGAMDARADGQANARVEHKEAVGDQVEHKEAVGDQVEREVYPDDRAVVRVDRRMGDRVDVTKRKRPERTHSYWDIFSFAQGVSGRINVTNDKSSDTRLLKLSLMGEASDRDLVFALALEIYRSAEFSTAEELRAVVTRRVGGLKNGTADGEENLLQTLVARGLRGQQRAREEAKREIDEELKHPIDADRQSVASSAWDDPRIANAVFGLVENFQRFDVMISRNRFEEVVRTALTAGLVTALSELRNKLNQHYYYPAIMSSRANRLIEFEEMMCTDVIVDAIAIMCSESMNTQKAQNSGSFVSSDMLANTLLQEKSSFEQFRRTYVRKDPFDWEVVPIRLKAGIRRPRGMRMHL
jgi:chromosome segregation ATPase